VAFLSRASESGSRFIRFSDPQVMAVLGRIIADSPQVTVGKPNLIDLEAISAKTILEAHGSTLNRGRPPSVKKTFMLSVIGLFLSRKNRFL
jgi:hypothetical protein